MVFTPRNIAAFFLSCCLITAGRIRKVKRRAEQGEIILSVYFHDPAKDLFESSVKWFIRNNFRFLTVAELHDILVHQKPFPKSSVIFTVDDGWKNNKENIVAVANKYKIPVTIFASTGPVETGEPYWWSYVEKARQAGFIQESPLDVKRLTDQERLAFIEKLKPKLNMPREALTIEELKEVDKTPYVNIESHTVTHPMLSKCSDEKSGREITESKKILEQWLNRRISHFAYPNGDYTVREIDFLKKAGYDIAFSTRPDYVKSDQKPDLFAIPRFDVLEDISFAENICRMTGVWFNKRSSVNPNS